MLDPARLAPGLRAACLRLGVRIHEHTPVHRPRARRRRRAAQPRRAAAVPRAGSRRARHQRVPAAAAPAAVVRRPGLRLRADDRAADRRRSAPPSAGRDRQGLADAGNLFHYYRLTDDDRILWGGYDAVYHFGGRTDDRLDRNPATFRRLGRALLRRPSRSWTALRFSHALGRGHRHLLAVLRVLRHRATAAGWPTPPGYTGLGVGATRFGAQVMLDLLDGRGHRADRLEMVRSKPLPFPPEPVRWAGIELTRRGARQGRRARRPARPLAAHPGRARWASTCRLVIGAS